MAKKIEFSGVHLFSVTPTDAKGGIAPEKLEAHINRAIDAGIISITVFGSTGAIGSFNEAERRTIAEAAVRYTAGRVPVIVGTGSMNTAEAIRLSQHAKDTGADAILVVPTTYWPLTEPELTAHYKAIADASGMPMVLYNNPRTTGVDMSPAFLASMCEISTVIAVKESAPDVSRIADQVRITKGRIPVLTGRDPQFLDAMMVGATGWFSGGANSAPELCVKLFNLVKSGRIDDARKYFDSLYPLWSYATAKGGVRVAHTALEIMGQSMGAPRAPLRMLEGEERRKLEQLLADLGLLDAAAKRAA
jgi:4-hydroxy-tetrahydrodipicolinate synthase